MQPSKTFPLHIWRPWPIGLDGGQVSFIQVVVSVAGELYLIGRHNKIRSSKALGKKALTCNRTETKNPTFLIICKKKSLPIFLFLLINPFWGVPQIGPSFFHRNFSIIVLP